MTQLQIMLRQPRTHGHIVAGAVATVRLLADVQDNVVKEWWSRTEPVAITGELITVQPTVFELPSGGHYGVDITLPRGPQISREYLVRDGETISETISMETSPHEYLGWQQFAGVIRSKPDYQDTFRGLAMPQTTGSDRLDTLLSEGQEKTESLYQRVKGIPQLYASTVAASDEAWASVAQTTRGGRRDWTKAGATLEWLTDWDDEYVTWLRQMPSVDEGMELIGQLTEENQSVDPLASRYPRWIAVDADGQTDLASVPWVWWGGSVRDDDEAIRFLYDRVSPSPLDRDAPGRFTISVNDHCWFGLLEFLASGRLSLAGGMFEQVMQRENPFELFDPETALRGKSKGPLVAVAGAIILIAQAKSTEPQIWDPWVENLSRWFPAIPDGPILLGCRRVAQAETLDDMNKAFVHLREGVQRGIPFFSASVRMLTITLAQISEDLLEAEDMRRFVLPVSLRVDPDQPFTVIRL